MRFLVFAFATLAVAACSNNGGGGSDASTDSSSGDGAAGCAGDYDCPNVSDHCFYPIDLGCSTAGPVGTCMPYTAPSNCTPTVACGCDGTTISVCAPAGYVDRPAAGPGACPPSDAGDDGATDDGATDDGATDASTDAADDAADAADE